MNDETDGVLEKADNLEAQGSKVEALGLLRQASQKRDDPIVLTRLGALGIDLELWREAEIALQKAVRLEPGLTLAHFYLGLLYKEQGRFAEALRCLTEPSMDQHSADIFAFLAAFIKQRLVSFDRDLHRRENTSDLHSR